MMASPIMRYFSFMNLSGRPRVVSANCLGLAEDMERLLPDGAEKSAGLRKLLEAKDCFVRAALDAEAGEET